MYYYAAEVYSEQSNQTTQIHRYTVFHHPFLSGESQTKPAI